MIVLLTRYFSCDQTKKIEMCGACGPYMWEGGGGVTYKVLMMKFEGNRPPGKPMHRWEGKQIRWEGPV